MHAHTVLVRRILARHGSRRDLRLWLNETKVAYVGEPAGRTRGGDIVLREARPISLGLFPGSADIVGIRFEDARWIWIEAKTGEGQLRPLQRAAMEMMEKAGAITCLARSVEDVDKVLGEPV